VEAAVEADVGAETGAEAGVEAGVEEKVPAEEERPGEGGARVEEKVPAEEERPREGGAREVCSRPPTSCAIVAKKAIRCRYTSPKSSTAITAGRSRSESGTPSRS
jgi:hypothetical protein